MVARIDLTGQRFGRLVAIRLGAPHQSPSRAQVTWECRCDCGTTVTVQRGSLRNGSSTSCGCSYKDLGIRKRTARHENIPEYVVWFHMKQRCLNKNDPDYKHYGGRGITVCAEWAESFDQFFASMGKRTSEKHSIDRIDVDGNYEPGNCRWATPLEQARNRRNTRYYIPKTNGKELANGS